MGRVVTLGLNMKGNREEWGGGGRWLSRRKGRSLLALICMRDMSCSERERERKELREEGGLVVRSVIARSLSFCMGDISLCERGKEREELRGRATTR